MDNDHSEKTGQFDGKTLISGVAVREDDLEEPIGLHITTILFRAAAIIIFLLAIWQFVAWWMDRPPGGVGIGVLVGDTIRLIVFAGLLWAISTLCTLWVKTHHDIRAGRILLARQTYMMRQMGIASGAVPLIPAEEERRGMPPEDTVMPGPDDRQA
jgi:hypothetical protein